MNKPTIAILGAGSMGEIFALGLLRAGWEPSEIILVARRPERAKELEYKTGITTLLSLEDAVSGRDIAMIGVKPKDVKSVLETIAPVITSDQTVVSIAAGVPLATFEEALPGIPIIRAMPNTPSAVDLGMTAFTAGATAGDIDIERASVLLGAVGETIQLSEDLIDAVTAVSGTGPAYVFLLAESMTEAAIREGLPHHAAEKLVHQTLWGAGALLAASEKSAFRLRGEVTSPGGTTAAALHVLEEGGFRALMQDAIQSAARQSRFLGEQASE